MGNAPDHEFLIIGAGFSGLGMAYRLRQQARDDFIILERAEGLGGTWRANTYPGCACDVPAHVYGYSYAPNPDWSCLFAGQAELLAYLEGFARTHDLERHIRYGQSVAALTFDESTRCWLIESADGMRLTARYVVAAAGPLATPALPEIDGLESFAGPAFHSAEWRHDVPLTGKRVGVIGTGASAIQFVPEIIEEVGALALFQRTAPWVLPRIERSFSEAEKARQKRHSWFYGLIRRWLYWRMEMRAVGFFRHPRALRLFEWAGRRHLHQQVKDPALREKLTPSFRFGCKRLLMSNDWYPAITSDKSEIITASIQRIVPQGVELENGDVVALDVLIMGTGFDAVEPMPGIEVTGRAGRSLHTDWARQGGAEAYFGSCVAGYPNLFLLLGPNTGLGHNSVVYMAEAQIEGILSIIRSAEERGTPFVEVREEVQEVHNNELRARLARSVWQTGGCRSWYQTADGKNTTLWPGFTFAFKKKLHGLPVSAFDFGDNRGEG